MRSKPGPSLGQSASVGRVPPEVVERCVSHWGASLVGVVFFGSAARKEDWELSDVDLLLVFEPGIRLGPMLYREWDSEIVPSLSGGVTDVSPQFVALPDDVDRAGSLWYEMSLDGVVLWERDGRVSGLLGRLRRVMADGRAQRRVSHGQPYWVHERVSK